MEGRHSVTRVSIDCIPPDFDDLLYGLPGADRTAKRLMVPITMMSKGTLKAFNMVDSNGQPAPIIGRSEYSEIMTDALIYELRTALQDPEADGPAVRKALTVILDRDAAEAEPVAIELVTFGTYKGLRIIDSDLISDYTAGLLLDLIEYYLLIALIPASHAGQRQVLKYSHEAVHDLHNAGPFRRLLLAAGLSALTVEFSLSHPSASASHHFEVVMPSRLDCESLEMPGLGTPDRNSADLNPLGVAHAVGKYEANPNLGSPLSGAELTVRVPSRGLRGLTSWICLLTGAILLLGLLLPGAQDALLDARDGASAMLLAIPAVVVAVVASRGEHAMVASLRRPLRETAIGCAVLLLACAASIVGGLEEPWRLALWWSGATWAVLAGVTLRAHELHGFVSGRVKTHRKKRDQEGGSNDTASQS